MNGKAKGILMILAAAVCWGVFPSFSRVLYGMGVSVMDTVAIRAFVAGGLYLMIGFARGSFKGLKIKDLPFLCFYGVAAIFSTYLFYALAVSELSSAMAAMLLYTAPAFVIIFNRMIYKDKITKIKLSALIITFAGSFLVVRAYDISSISLNLKGIVFGLLSGIGYSMLTVIGRTTLKKHSAQVGTFVPTIFTAVIMLFIVPPHTLQLNGWVSIVCALGIGIVGSVLPYMLYLGGLEKGVDGGNAVTLANAEPVVASIAGSLFFKDAMSLPQLIGIILVICGAALPNINFGKKSAEKAKDKETGEK